MVFLLLVIIIAGFAFFAVAQPDGWYVHVLFGANVGDYAQIGEIITWESVAVASYKIFFIYVVCKVIILLIAGFNSARYDNACKLVFALISLGIVSSFEMYTGNAALDFILLMLIIFFGLKAVEKLLIGLCVKKYGVAETVCLGLHMKGKAVLIPETASNEKEER